MKYFSLSFFLLLNCAVHSQSNDQGKFYLGFSFSPNICFRTLSNNHSDSGMFVDELIKLRNSNETLKTGYTTGLDFGYNLNSSMSIELGMHYSNIGYQQKLTEARVLAPDPSIPEKFKNKYHMHYIDIPLRFNYIFNEDKFQFFGSLGITTHFFQKEMAVSVAYFKDRTEKNRRETTYAYNTINISPTVSAGIIYPLGDRFKIRIEPTFRYGALKILNAPLVTHLYSFGINTGIYCKL